MDLIADKIELLPRKALIATSHLDKGLWNYVPVLATAQRQRFRMAITLLGPKKHGKLLEIGYGSGIFMPELSKYCEELIGVDIHERNISVHAILSKLNIHASLFQACASELPFSDDSIDIVVSISSLEYVKDIAKATKRICQCLKKDGALITVFPAESAFANFAFRFFHWGRSAKSEYGNHRAEMVESLKDRFTVEEKLYFPNRGSFYLYHAIKWRQR